MFSFVHNIIQNGTIENDELMVKKKTGNDDNLFMRDVENEKFFKNFFFLNCLCLFDVPVDKHFEAWKVPMFRLRNANFEI